jgi:hypothetical protein
MPQQQVINRLNKNCSGHQKWRKTRLISAPLRLSYVNIISTKMINSRLLHIYTIMIESELIRKFAVNADEKTLIVIITLVNGKLSPFSDLPITLVMYHRTM